MVIYNSIYHVWTKSNATKYHHAAMAAVAIINYHRSFIKLIWYDIEMMWSHTSEQASLFQSIYELQTVLTNDKNFLSSPNWYYRLKLSSNIVHGPTNKQANNNEKNDITIQCYLILVQIFIEAFFRSLIKYMRDASVGAGTHLWMWVCAVYLFEPLQFRNMYLHTLTHSHAHTHTLRFV